MTIALWLTCAGIVLLLAMSFFFSGSETALTAASRARMHQLARAGDKRAELVESLSTEKERLIGAILLGNNVVNILASTLAASVLIALFGQSGIAYATLGMTAAVVIFSEVLPKTLALMRPDGFALAVAPAVRVVVFLFAPVTLAVQGIVNAILRLFGLDASNVSAISGRDEIRGTLNLLHSEGEVVKGDRDMLGGILDLSDLAVSDVMVHRTQMTALDADQPIEALVDAVLASAYTRIPLYRGESDDIVGMVHAKDVLRAVAAAKGDMSQISIEQIASKPWFIPQSTPVQTQLAAFLKRHTHMALVLDEYGVLEGLVTLEDIIEEIVGDISDEHDEPDDEALYGIEKQPDGSYIVDASIPIRDINRALDWDLPDTHANTVAGIVIIAARIIPDPGHEVSAHGFDFVVLARDRQRVSKVRIVPQPDQNAQG
ncbi:HlyC/CorC family transporter [Devosia sp. PTR5]|jgi:Mg2+/Co2+ transporter CorB|uniref:HlyC/CorC family transporter n=1 Tax=Devosia oryzisoli TaxID=2774138 RepID=A0A927FXE3_9HYPH|nr:HlyC/CorC family transporter [Devosia oryzisoli]MBD8067032.1 HlyC/CorC family transporter [Devosia oryzisoli]